MKRKSGERQNNKCVFTTVKHSDGSVMVWGVWWVRKGWKFDSGQENHKKRQYYSILQRHALPPGLHIIGKKNHLSTRQQSKWLF